MRSRAVNVVGGKTEDIGLQGVGSAVRLGR